MFTEAIGMGALASSFKEGVNSLFRVNPPELFELHVSYINATGFKCEPLHL